MDALPQDLHLENMGQRLENIIQRQDPALHDMMRYALIRPGKKCRALMIFTLASCFQAKTSHHPAILDLACVVECIHAASLIHDDIIDQAKERNRQESFHQRFGLHRAILMGDLLYAEALLSLENLKNDRVRLAITKAASRMIQAEIAHHHATTASYWTIIDGKTGALFSAAALSISAIVQSAHQEWAALLGSQIGRLYQFLDDWTDALHQEDQAQDLKTLPGELLKSGQLDKLKEILNQQKQDLEQHLMLLSDPSSIERIHRFLERFIYASPWENTSSHV